MSERRDDVNPVDGPARRWYVPDGALLSKLVRIHAVLFAILHVVAYLTGEGPGSEAIVSVVPVLATLVLSLRLAIRMTGMALLTAMVVVYALLFVILHVIAYLTGLQREPSLSGSLCSWCWPR